MTTNTAEKIETIVMSFLKSQTAAGAFGEIVEFEPGHYRVTTDGKTYIVRSPNAAGWSVSFKGFRGIDRDLYTAARFAMDGGSRRDVSTVEEALG